ncbi:MAG: radical SAM protein, partial [Firmicutes bacterium]|nr:radical SAM protein [Bacillota bacterium]
RLGGTKEITEFIADEISRDTYINIMAQYRPEYRGREYPPLDRRITQEEYKEAVSMTRKAGLYRLAR